MDSRASYFLTPTTTRGRHHVTEIPHLPPLSAPYRISYAAQATGSPVDEYGCLNCALLYYQVQGLALAAGLTNLHLEQRYTGSGYAFDAYATGPDGEGVRLAYCYQQPADVFVAALQAKLEELSKSRFSL